jgi:CBS domain-containing protein
MTGHLEHIRVHDAMHHGLISCSAEAPLSEVTALMVKHRVHAVAVSDGTGARPTGVVSDLDVIGAAARGEEATAGQVAPTAPLAISAEDRLQRAAQLMAGHGVSHLVVLDPAGGFPIGILSTLDIAAVYADAARRARRPRAQAAGMTTPRE